MKAPVPLTRRSPRCRGHWCAARRRPRCSRARHLDAGRVEAEVVGVRARPTASSRWLPSATRGSPLASRRRRSLRPSLARTPSIPRRVRDRDPFALRGSRGSPARRPRPRARSAAAPFHDGHACRSAGTSARTRGRCSCRRRRPDAAAGSRRPSSSCWSRTARRRCPAGREQRPAPPTLMKICSALSVLAVTCTVRGPKSAHALDERQFACRRSHFFDAVAGLPDHACPCAP